MRRTLVGGPADGTVVDLDPSCRVFRWTPPRPDLCVTANGPTPMPTNASYQVYDYGLRECGDMHYAS